MIISYTSRNGFEFKAHATRKDAVEYLLGGLNGDYGKDFWSSDDGEKIVENPHSSLDFGLVIYNSPEEALADLECLDDDIRDEVVDAVNRAVAAGKASGF